MALRPPTTIEEVRQALRNLDRRLAQLAAAPTTKSLDDLLGFPDGVPASLGGQIVARDKHGNWVVLEAGADGLVAILDSTKSIGIRYGAPEPASHAHNHSDLEGVTADQHHNESHVHDNSVLGPASSTDDALAVFDGTTGKLVKANSDESKIGDGSTSIIKLTFLGPTNNGQLWWIGSTDTFVFDDDVLIAAGQQLRLGNSASKPPLNVTERSAEPSAPATNDIYLDDGTNTGSGNPGWRRYTGAAWENVGGGGDTHPMVDTTELVKGSTTASKIAKIECDTNIPNATTVTVAWPAVDLDLKNVEEFQTAEYDNGNSGSGTATIDWRNGRNQKITITGACTFAFTNPTPLGIYRLRMLWDGTGGYSISWPASSVLGWIGNAEPTWSTAGGAKDLLVVHYYETSKYWGTGYINFA